VVAGIGYQKINPNDMRPGWYAVSVNCLYNREGQYRYFLNFKPIAMAGYSIYIYHITPEEIDRVRHEEVE
jgi:hypothetical protein